MRKITGLVAALSVFPVHTAEAQSVPAPSMVARPQGAASLDVRSFGALCDGRANDTAAFNAAARAAGATGGAVIQIPPGSCKLSGVVTITASGVTVKGQGRGATTITVTTANLAHAFNFTSTSNTIGSGIQDLTINMGALGANTAGVAVDLNNGWFNFARNLTITNPCIGVSVNGGVQQVDDVYVSGVEGSACQPIQIGTETTGAQTLDARITNSHFQCNQTNPGLAGMLIEDAGGLILENDDIIWCSKGTLIQPNTGQQVIWTFGDNTVLGDTTASDVFVIDTLAASAQVKGFSCTNCWVASSAGGSGVVIKNTGRGVVDGVHFTALRDYNEATNGADLFAGSDITFDASHVCGYGQVSGAAGIVFENRLSNAAVRNTTIRPGCDANPAGKALYGLLFSTGNANIVATDNVISGNAKADVGGSPTGSNLVWIDKDGLVVPQTLFTVSTLPACNAATRGAFAVVTDASAPTYNGALTGGGAVVVSVFCSGSAWTAH